MISSVSAQQIQPNRQPIERPAPQRPLPQSPFGTDTVTLSSEALGQQSAAVDPARCGNDWRCLEQLQERGLLA